MEQRIYYGNINPNALADYLVGIYHQPPYYYQQHTRAQKIMQGKRIFVQIMRTSDWSGGGHRALGVHILSIAGGVSIEMGASDWLDLDEAGLAGMLLGALFFPPLLLFPLIQGLSNFGFSHEVWNVIDSYCMQASGAQSRRAHTPQGFYCTYCGAFNHPAATHCHACQAPFNVAPPPQPTPAEPAQPTPSTPVEPVPEVVVCPACGASVADAKFCGNCAAPLHEEAEQQG